MLSPGLRAPERGHPGRWAGHAAPAPDQRAAEARGAAPQRALPRLSADHAAAPRRPPRRALVLLPGRRDSAGHGRRPPVGRESRLRGGDGASGHGGWGAQRGLLRELAGGRAQRRHPHRRRSLGHAAFPRGPQGARLELPHPRGGHESLRPCGAPGRRRGEALHREARSGRPHHRHHQRGHLRPRRRAAGAYSRRPRLLHGAGILSRSPRRRHSLLRLGRRLLLDRHRQPRQVPPGPSRPAGRPRAGARGPGERGWGRGTRGGRGCGGGSACDDAIARGGRRGLPCGERCPRRSFHRPRPPLRRRGGRLGGRRRALGGRDGRGGRGAAGLHLGRGRTRRSPGPDRSRHRPRRRRRGELTPFPPTHRSAPRDILSQMAIERIRNFSIVAHIDHGKSTLADRLLSLTGTMDAKKAVGQVLDSMDLEKERGITIKAHTVRLLYTARDGREYTLNLIDTPGHVDFSYEVSRSLAACEGAVLIVDAGQGVEAQTLANFYLALDGGLEIVPVINKIDLPAADVEGTRAQITDILGLDGDEALAISAKHGTGVPEVLEAIVTRIPRPAGDPDAPLKALVFDSFYDSYQGVVVYVRLTDGRVRPGTRILLMSNGRAYDVQQVGVFSPDMRPVEELSAGQVGYLTASIKRVADAKVGETITEVARPTTSPFPGYRDAKPMVFAGLYSIDDTDYEALRDALEKLRLNDPAFTYEPETSLALGYGFRCGFLGMLHMEIVQERLEREFNLSLIVTAPSVQYKVLTTAGEVLDIDNPSKLPSPDRIEQMDEPFVKASIFVPTEFMTA